MSDKEVLRLLIESVTRRSVVFLDEQAGLTVEGVEYSLQSLKTLKLRDMTSLVGIGGALGMYVAFSFDQHVIRRIFEVYTADLEIEPDMEAEYIEETASDVVNTIIGNALADLPNDVPAISLTPPLVLSEAKSISRHKDAFFYMSNLSAPDGMISIMYIGPKDLFDENLEYREEQ